MFRDADLENSPLFNRNLLPNLLTALPNLEKQSAIRSLLTKVYINIGDVDAIFGVGEEALVQVETRSDHIT